LFVVFVLALAASTKVWENVFIFMIV